jgi:CDP-diacylglycerol--glycerol-3-phosphate 3-phosphatidyltransferase
VPLPHHHIIATIIFILAAFTDLFDGYLARRLAQITRFGEFLDPVADKLMVATALILISVEFNSIYITIPAIIITCREIIISALREWMAEIGKRTSVAVSVVGKIKTTLQLGALILLLLYQPGSEGFGLFLEVLGVIGLYAAAILTLWSMVMYLRAAWSDIYITKSSSK